MKKISIVATILLFASLIGSAQVKGEFLKVQGDARLFATPELMFINIPFEVSSKSYSQCSDMLIKNYNLVLEALVKNGFDRKKIKTSGLSISENYQWVQNKRVKDGFQGRIQMHIEEKHTPEMLQAFMKTLKDDRFDYGYNLSFKLSEEQKELLLEQAIKEAVQDANTKASILAKSLNVELRKIKEVNFDVTQISAGPLLRENQLISMKMADAGSDKGISLEAQTQQIMKSVAITWVIKQ